jgi:putative nucleotidyltransferase with HDIG domain
VTDGPQAAPRAHPTAALAAALLILAGAVPVLLSLPAAQLTQPLTLVLMVGASVSVLSAAKWNPTTDVSSGFVCAVLAGVFVGPLAAFAVPAVAELVSWTVLRYRLVALPINLAGIAVPSMLSAIAFDALAGVPMQPTVTDVGTLAVVSVGFLVANVVVSSALVTLLDGLRLRETLRSLLGLLPSFGLTLALAVATAGVYASLGAAAGLFLVVVFIAFRYMTQLVVIARERTGQYAALSWGVLSALVRSLDRRDSRTARHSAAVAAFARDIAIECAMSKRDVELAHTAGLLHDIGRFALPDRVMERHGTLTEDDWEAIRLHPELGADLLRDLGVYGPVATIVRAHHERPDGRGYPDRLKGEEIPQIARIVAVAEVYDTLTAEDTYRDRMTSFQAITELRRVAGRQLDGRYVEALATLLAGRGTDYRHADTADFDSELAIQGRIADAVGTDSAAGSGVGAVAEPAS